MSSNRPNTIELSFVLFGAEYTGKTTLLNFFDNDKTFLTKKYVRTITNECVIKFSIKENVKIHVWDTSGDLNFLKVSLSASAFPAKATAFLLAFNFQDKTTFDSLPTLINELKHYNKPMH